MEPTDHGSSLQERENKRDVTARSTFCKLRLVRPETLLRFCQYERRGFSHLCGHGGKEIALLRAIYRRTIESLPNSSYRHCARKYRKVKFFTNNNIVSRENNICRDGEETSSATTFAMLIHRNIQSGRIVGNYPPHFTIARSQRSLALTSGTLSRSSLNVETLGLIPSVQGRRFFFSKPRFARRNRTDRIPFGSRSKSNR